jgi:GMP synthase (glutamine-hydrolysing)
MKSIGVIDCFMIAPAINCFNHLVHSLPNNKLFYHLPGQHNLNTLENSNHDAYIILGSASHVHQNLEWHLKLAQFIDHKLLQQIPVIGCCFGHQLMAHFYGSQVEFFQANEDKITGVRSIVLEKDLGLLKQGQEIKLGVTHRQVVKNLADCFISFTQNSNFPNDIIRHKTLPFLGLQPHPEASEYFLKNECLIDDPNKRKEVSEYGLKIIKEFLKINQLC